MFNQKITIERSHGTTRENKTKSLCLFCMTESIRNMTCGLNALGQPALIHSSFSYLKGHAPAEIAKLTKEGYLEHDVGYANPPCSIVGDWEDAKQPIICLDEFTLTDKAVDALKKFYGQDLVIDEYAKDNPYDTWLVDWQNRGRDYCSRLATQMTENENTPDQYVHLLDACKQFFSSGTIQNIDSRDLSMFLLLSYVIEYIAREDQMYNDFHPQSFYLSDISEEDGWFKFCFSENEEDLSFSIRVEGFAPVFLSVLCDYDTNNTPETFTCIQNVLAIKKFLKHTDIDADF